jgi:membrane associated rhomboid family serine protease
MPLLSWSYWFSLQARELMPNVKLAMLVLFVALIVFGVVASRFVKKSGSMLMIEGAKRLSLFGIWMGIMGLILVFFTHELVYFFGARFWYLVWLVVAVWWLIAIIRHLTVVVPGQSASFAEKARIEKWIPKGK